MRAPSCFVACLTFFPWSHAASSIEISPFRSPPFSFFDPLCSLSPFLFVVWMPIPVDLIAFLLYLRSLFFPFTHFCIRPWLIAESPAGSESVFSIRPRADFVRRVFLSDIHLLPPLPSLLASFSGCWTLAYTDVGLVKAVFFGDHPFFRSFRFSTKSNRFFSVSPA